ncbi:MAG: FGGY-family carbohydrate kinase [Leptolyngbyaceae cyanobacterium MO_188.B28]|nr:FGGY-family carbohydrate kinase [Leptolyngbyaceae cyanobacterium MO_188.B28]
MTLSLGIDFGTSGARAIAIDSAGAVKVQLQRKYPNSENPNWIEIWKQTLFSLIQRIPRDIRDQIGAIAIDGTSATALLCDRQGVPIVSPLFYNDSRGKSVLSTLKAIAPSDHPVISATSTLAKLLWWCEGDPDQIPQNAHFLMHQADWLGYLLHNQLGVSDYHNALKLGYDVGDFTYPDWLIDLELSRLLPKVIEPGCPIAPVQASVADQLDLPKDCQICAGTTDSIAAFLASGAHRPGEAVTSLGSTLVLKLLSETRVDNSEYGIYSHRLGDLWLVGGASNSGGAVLRQFFDDAEIKSLSAQIQVGQACPLNYYPLVSSGERFPINDPNLSPRLDPRPPADADFLYGILDGIARIEATGYKLLQTLGATPLTRVYTAGGGAKNDTWTAIRRIYLQTPVVTSRQTEAAYGSALLALKSIQ